MATAAFLSLLVALTSTVMLVTHRMGRTRPIADDVDIVDVGVLGGRAGVLMPAPSIPGAPYRGAVNLVALLGPDQGRERVEKVIGGVDLTHFGARLVEVIHSSGTAHLFDAFGVGRESGVVVVDGQGRVRSRLNSGEVQARTLRSLMHETARSQAGRST